jgi:hypothetical protein
MQYSQQYTYPSQIRKQHMRQMETRNGYMKFWRLGNLEFGEQSRWGRAPRSRGMWAFPYPYFDKSFASHKYYDILPKRLETAETTMEEVDRWVKKVGRKVVPIREFWYKGDVFSHFTPNGEPGDTGLFDPDDTDWHVTDSVNLKKFIIKSGTDKVTVKNDAGGLNVMNSSLGHMEVFIAPNMGIIRNRNPRT